MAAKLIELQDDILVETEVPGIRWKRFQAALRIEWKRALTG
jgi:hypothetical protein